MKLFERLKQKVVARRAIQEDNPEVEQAVIEINKTVAKTQATRRRSQAESEQVIRQTVFGVHSPHVVWFFLTIGFASEVVDAIFMKSTLEVLGPELDPMVATVISAIVGASCFFSMAFVGFQQGNRRYHSQSGERIAYAFWALTGIALVGAKLLAGLVSGNLNEAIAGNISFSKVFVTEGFIANATIAIVQAILYVGTGLMTRDSVRILTDNDLREYNLARRKHKKLLEKLSELRGDLVNDIAKIKTYPKYASRLVKSKQSVKKNIAQYNESARALIEAKMAISVDPDLMEDMYDRAMEKEGRA